MNQPSRIYPNLLQALLLGSLWPGLAVVRSCSPVVLQMNIGPLSGEAVVGSKQGITLYYMQTYEISC